MIKVVERIAEHIAQRRVLRELVEGSEEVYARVYNSNGISSTLMKTSGGLLGIDGMFGNAVEMGIRIDIIGLDKQKKSLGPVKLI